MSNDEIRGVEIFNFAGKRVGSVLYPVWKCKSKKVDGLVVIKNCFLQLKFFLPYSSVDKYENGKIYLIKNYKTKKTDMDTEYIRAVINGEDAHISRFDFNEETGSVKSVEIAKNIFEDIQNKRQIYSNFSVVNGLIIIEEGKK